MKDTNQKWRDLFGSEWEYIRKLGSCFRDPEEKKAFWDSVRERKLADPSFSIYTLFPTSETAKEKAARECVDFVRSLRRPVKDEESA